jgi:hypothetical protein
MNEKKDIIGYYAEDGNIYCVECINKNSEMMKTIDKAITADNWEENPHVCDACKGKINNKVKKKLS